MRRLQLVVALALCTVTLTADQLDAAIPWMRNLREAQQIARQQQRLVLLHFYADWCGPCLRLEREVFPRPDVSQTISSNFVPVKIDVDRQPELARQYDIRSFPTDVVLDPAGRVLLRSPTPGDAARYIQLLNGVAANSAAANSPYAAAPQGERPAGPYPGPPWASSPPASAAAPQAASPPNSAYAYGAPSPGGDSRGAAEPDYNRPYAQGPALNQSAYAPPYASRYAAEQPYGPAGYLANSPPEERVQGNPYANQPESRYDAAVSGYGMTSRGPSEGTDAAPFAEHRWGPSNSVAMTQPPRYASDSGSAPMGAAPAADEQSSARPPEPLATPAAAELPLALEGYCPVTLAQQESWQRGDPRWGAIHRGRTYLFTAESNQQRFMADPDRYSPVLSGYDPTRFIDYGEVLLGQRKHGLWFRGKMYLFADEGSLGRFQQSPEYYAQKSHEIMMRGTGR